MTGAFEESCCAEDGADWPDLMGNLVLSNTRNATNVGLRTSPGGVDSFVDYDKKETLD